MRDGSQERNCVGPSPQTSLSDFNPVFGRPRRAGPPSVAVSTAVKWHQQRIDPARLVFIDETWTKTNMAPLRG